MIQYPNRITDPHINIKLREIIDAVNSNTSSVDTVTSTVNQTTTILTPTQLKQAQQNLQTGGTVPLNLTGLPGGMTVFIGTHAQRLLQKPIASQFFLETDRTTLYVGNGSAWLWTGGNMISTRVNAPADLVANDAGFNLYISDYVHGAIWDGSHWQLTDGGGGWIVGSAVTLGTGWQICDGSTTDYIQNNTTNLAVASVTLPNLSGTPGTYLASGTFTGSINAASRPTQVVQSGTGVTVAAPITADPISNLAVVYYFRR